MMTQTSQCKHCTVPTDGSDLCSFCATYDGPAITDSSLTGPGMTATPADGLLAGAHTHARQAAEDLQDVLAELDDNAPLLAVVDAVAARAHLVAAQRLIDKAAERITAQEVVR